MAQEEYFPSVQDIETAAKTLSEILEPTPLMRNPNLSEKYEADVYLKREDLQMVRSYKIRGAYNMIKSLSPEVLKYGVVCASAGNHAQGVAFSCHKLNIMGSIYMPTTTPKQKIEQVRMFGKGNIDIVLTGDTFDAANAAAIEYANKSGKTFIPPFDHKKIIEGQGTIGLEIFHQMQEPLDYIFIPIGGGGLASGVGSFIRQVWPETKIIGVEPAGAASMKAAIEKGEIVDLPTIDKFVDGAAVKKAGEYTFRICRKILDDIVAVPEGAVCTSIIDMYNKSAIVVEPAGALSVAALRFYADKIKGKKVGCIVSGSNNDITRTEEIREKSMLYEGLKHYFIVTFPQRSGAILSFIRDVIGPTDDLVHIQYIKKTNKEEGPALIGIEVASKEDYQALINRMKANNINYEYINENNKLFEILI
ncbi:MAG: threonine ammonia-lyase [Bacteroidetes bacterium]|uniref:L-threonine dehydratase n=1 Tax=Candidatus Cryptobacteroides excrementipullorum TaxID=2840761 RepID=A0A9D9NMY2_9BACT|nr:threonine ammonia-lyase [Candidatus Cryptobacteroides excrementipullorum]